MSNQVSLYNGNSLVGTYTTIQDAINAAAPGDTIQIGTGTYNENVNVNKDNLTIENVSGDQVTVVGTGGFGGAITVAAGVNGTTVQSSDSTAANFVLQAAPTGELAALYIAGSNTNTTISGITATGSAVGGGGGNNAVLTGGSLTDLTFQNNVFNGNLGPNSQLVYINGAEDIGPSAQNGDVNFINNTFSGSASGGLLGMSAPGQVTGNTFSGTSPVSVGLNEAGVTVSGNTFSSVQSIGYFFGNGSYDPQTIEANNTFPQQDEVYIVHNGQRQDGVFSSIQAAIDNASAGDTIVAGPGTYNESLNIDKGVTILGANAGISGTGVRGAETILTGQSQITTTSQVTIDGVEFLDNKPYTLSSSDTFVGLTIVNSSTAGDVVEDSVFDRAPSVDPNSSSTTFVGSNSQPTHRGIEIASVTGGTAVTIENNLFTGVNPYSYAGDDWRSAVYSNGGAGTTTIENNTFENVRSAVNADNFSSTVQITGNSFDHDGSGVSVGVGSDVTNVTSITNNTFGVAVDNEFNFKNLTTPVTFNAGATNNVLSAAAAANPNEYIYIEGGSAGDNLTGTSGNDILLGDAGNNTFNATAGNDIIQGGAGIDTVQGFSADFGIAISNGQWVVSNDTNTDTLSGIEDVVINGKTYELVDKFGANGGFQSLQAAIDNAAAGTTILVAPGTYTEAANYDPTTGLDDMTNGTNPVGLLVDKSGLTIEGVDKNGDPITSTSTLSEPGENATIVSSIQSNWGTNFFVTAPNVTISGLNFQATDNGAGIVNKAFEDNANNFTLENSVVGATAGVPLGSSVYIDDWNASSSPSFVSSITQYDVANNILAGDFVEASGTGAGNNPASLNFDVENNEFSLNAGTTAHDYTTADGGFSNVGVILNGNLLPGVGWDVASVAAPEVSGNTMDANYTESPTGGRFFAADDSAAKLPSVSYIQNYVANNTWGTYAYVLTSSGGLETPVVNYGSQNSPSNAFTYQIYINVGDATAPATNLLPDGANPGDTVIVQSGSDNSVQTIGTNNLTIDAQNGSTALDLSLGSGVTSITLADYAAGQGANVTVTGNASGDTITGNDGNDTLSGGTGNDTFNLGSGNNTVTGGGGLDTAHVASTLTAASFSFSNNEWVVTNGTGTDDLSGISIVTDGAGHTFLLVGGGSEYTSAAQAKSSPQFQAGDVVLGPPVVIPASANVSAASNQTFAASSLFSATDTEGHPILQYEVEDVSTGSSNGFWSLNGLVEANGHVFTVTPAQLSQLTFTAGSASTSVTDTIQVAASDSGGLGAFTTFTVTASKFAPGDVAPTVSALIAQALPESTLPASSVFSGSVPQGESIVGYEVEDTNGDWVFNGTPVAANQLVDVSAAQLSQLTLDTGFGTDTLTVRANDGTQWGSFTTIQITQQPNAAPPAGSSADMILVQNASGIYEVFDIGTNTILAMGPLDQISTAQKVVDIGGFDGADTSDMLTRDSTTGAFTLYDVSNNNVTGNVTLGQVGSEWAVSGFGDFSSHAGETDMLMQKNNGVFEVFDISNNAITFATSMGQVGSEWSVSGFGDFSSNAGESDMLMRRSNGQFGVFDISHNAITSFSSIGQVGMEWQVAGFGDFSGNANETDMLMRNANTGAFEIFDISHNAITSAASMGQVGLEWTVAGFGDFSGNANETDMLMRNSNSGAFEIFDISHNAITSAASMGQVGTEWSVSGFAGLTAGAPPSTQLSGIAADPAGSATAQLTQAMASFAPSGAALATSSPIDQTTPPTAAANLLTTPNHA